MHRDTKRAIRNCSYLILFILFLTLMFCVVGFQKSSHEASIKDWAAKNNHVVKQIDRHYFDIGPYYWADKNTAIYKVQTEDGTYWFRFHLFGPDIERYDE